MNFLSAWNLRKFIWAILFYLLFLSICFVTNKELETISEIPGFITVIYDFLSSDILANIVVVVMTVMISLDCCRKSLRKKYVDLGLLYIQILALTILLVFDALEYVPVCGFLDYRRLGIILLGVVMASGTILKIPAVNRLISKLINNRKNIAIHTQEPDSCSFEVSTKPEEYQDTEWDEFISNLIARIKTADTTKESFAVGITGTWGEGKTQMLSMIKDKLADEYVFEFNPWKNSDNISMNFINELNSYLSNQIPVGNTLNRYAKMLRDSEAHPISTLLSSFYLSLGGASLYNQAEKVSACFDKLNSNIYVIIDDLDRLDAGEILEVLKLIRNTASFRRLVYVVAYDKQYVADLLESVSIAKQEEYLKKIFPLQVSVPKLPYGFLAGFLKKEIRRLLPNDTRVRSAEFSKIILTTNNQYEYVVENYLHNLRDVKNFAMSFTMSYETIASNIDWIKEYDLSDFFWLEIMHFSYGEMYHDLKDGFLDCIELQGYNSIFPRYILRADKEEYQKLNRHQKQLLLYLFNTDGKSLNRLANFIDFPKYFQIRLPKNEMPISIFKDMIYGKISISEYLEMRHSEGSMPRRSLSFYLNIQKVEDDVMTLDMMKRYVDILLKWASLEWHEQPFARTIATKLPYYNEDLMYYLLEKLKEWGNNVDKSDDKDEKLRVFTRIQFFLKGIYQRLRELESRRNVTFSYFFNEENGLQTLINENYARFITLLPLRYPSEVVVSSRMNAFLVRSSVKYKTGGYSNNLPDYESDNFIIHKIIEKFSSSSSSDDYQQVMNAFDLKPSEIADDSTVQISTKSDKAEQDVRDNICETFGSVNIYKEFLEKCFNIPVETLKDYFSRINI